MLTTRDGAAILVRGRPVIGPGLPPYLVAEIGTNHNRSLETARDMVRRVAQAGCDCAKFQIYEPGEIVSGRISARDYGLNGLYGDISAREMFERHLKTPKAWFPELRDLCHTLGLDCAATIHGPDSLAWAQEMAFDVIKVASMDHTNIPLLESLINTVAAPILISFGMAQLDDIDTAVASLREHRHGIGLFHCVASYPPEPHELRLGNIVALGDRYNLPIGFSDHTEDGTTALMALALGARFFEKHVTLDRRSSGPDHPFALEFENLAQYAQQLKAKVECLSDPTHFASPSKRERSNRSAYLKSVIVRRDLPAGHELTAEDLYLARPGTGLAPQTLHGLVGRRLARDVPAETPLVEGDLIGNR